MTEVDELDYHYRRTSVQIAMMLAFLFFTGAALSYLLGLGYSDSDYVIAMIVSLMFFIQGTLVFVKAMAIKSRGRPRIVWEQLFGELEKEPLEDVRTELYGDTE